MLPWPAGQHQIPEFCQHAANLDNSNGQDKETNLSFGFFGLGYRGLWLLQQVLKPVLECFFPSTLSDILHGHPQVGKQQGDGNQVCEGSGNHKSSGKF